MLADVLCRGMLKDHDVIEVDAVGLRCPLPVLRLRRALQSAPAGTVIKLLASDGMTKVDVPAFCHQAGVEVTGPDEADDGTLIYQVLVSLD